MKTAKILLGILMATTLTHEAMSSMLNKIIQIPVLELNKFNKIEKTSNFEFNPSEILPLKYCYT